MLAPLLIALAIAGLFVLRRAADSSLATRAGALVPAFHEVGGADVADARFRGSVFTEWGNPADWFGTFVGGDDYTGTIQSADFAVTGPYLELPIIGYPNRPGNSLALEVRDDRGELGGRVAFGGENPGEWQGVWVIPTERWLGMRARLVLVDGTTGGGGWLGVSSPRFEPSSSVIWLSGVPRNYGLFALAALGFAGLLFLPGLLGRTLAPRFFEASPMLLAVPGLLSFVVLGLLAWIFGPMPIERIAPWWIGLNVVGAAWLVTLWWRTGCPLGAVEWGALTVYACVTIGSLAYQVLPLEVGQEYSARRLSQGRMVASPPDCEIPFWTAVYFWHGTDRRAPQSAYFSKEWNAGSRGPISPLAIAGGFTVAKIRPTEPPRFVLSAWPASVSGYHIARIIGALTNALVILAGAGLASRLRPASWRFAIAWLAVAPGVVANVDFIWPKLLATAFVVLAVQLALKAGTALGMGMALALAYLAHPVGGLFAVPVGLFVAHLRWQEAPGTVGRRWCVAVGGLVRVAAATLVCVLPWLIYKASLGGSDVFWYYPLGDGSGFSLAASATTWLSCRWSNLWLTLVPTTFFFSGNMGEWLQGPVSAPLRWVIGYTRSLPGQLGMVAFVLSLPWLLRRPERGVLRVFRAELLLGSLLLLLLYWGFSRDGLGRNCLEPLSVIAILFLAARGGGRLAKWIVAIAALEMVSMRVMGMAFAVGAAEESLNLEMIVLGAVSLVASLVPVVLFARAASDDCAISESQAELPAGSPRAAGA